MPTSKKRSGKLLGELLRPGPLAHGRGDGQDLLVLLRDLDHRLAEDAENDGAPFALQRLARRDLERPGAVELLRVCPGRLVALALLGHALDEDRAVVCLGRLEGLDERLDAVALDRPDVADARALRRRGPGRRSS